MYSDLASMVTRGRKAMIPLIDLVPKGLTDAQCRAKLRSSRRFKPFNGRWLFKPASAERVRAYLAK